VHRRNGWTALHYAAQYSNRRIVGSLVGANADVNAQDRYNGCAVSAAANRRSAPAESPPRLPCRLTPLHWAAAYGKTNAIAELLLRGADGAVQNCTR
jgi:ankyrin repeat protein